jgi:hypothetical protein
VKGIADCGFQIENCGRGTLLSSFLLPSSFFFSCSRLDVPVRHGFLYLVALMDWFSRYAQPEH